MEQDSFRDPIITHIRSRLSLEMGLVSLYSTSRRHIIFGDVPAARRHRERFSAIVTFTNRIESTANRVARILQRALLCPGSRKSLCYSILLGLIAWVAAAGGQGAAFVSAASRA